MPVDALLNYNKEQKLKALRVFLQKFSAHIKLIDGVTKTGNPTPALLKKKELYNAQVLVLFKSLSSEMTSKDLEKLCPPVNTNYFFDNHNLRTPSLSDSITIEDIQEEQKNYEDHLPIIVEVNKQLIEMLPKEGKVNTINVSGGLRKNIPGSQVSVHTAAEKTNTTLLSEERIKLMKILNNKDSSWRHSAATKDLIPKARDYLILELKNPNSKISVMRTKEFHSHHGTSTIEQILVSSDSQLKNLLDVTQEKEEGKHVEKTHERNSVETGSPSQGSILIEESVEFIVTAASSSIVSSEAQKALVPRREAIIKDMALIVIEIYRLLPLLSVKQDDNKKIMNALIENCATFDFLRAVLLTSSDDSKEAILASLGKELQSSLGLDSAVAQGQLDQVLQHCSVFENKNKLSIYLACEELKTQNITCVPEGVSQTTRVLVNPSIIANKLKNHSDIQAHIAPPKDSDAEMNAWRSAADVAIKAADKQILWLNVTLFFHNFYHALFGDDSSHNESLLIEKKIEILTTFKTKVKASIIKKDIPSVAKTSLNNWALERTLGSKRPKFIDSNISVLEQHRDKDIKQQTVETTSAAIVKDLLLGPSTPRKSH